MNKNTCMQELDKFSDRVRGFAWDNKECYASWAAQTHYFVSHSTRLIALAASRFYKDKDSLHQRFLKHISEEAFHEKLAERDIKALGLDIKNFPELSSTKGFYQSQYYQIERESPESFLGYIVALEGIAVLAGEKALATVSEAFGGKAASFLKVHAEEDKKHIEDALHHMFSLDEVNLRKAYANFIQSSELYCSMLDEIENKYGSIEFKKSA